MQKANLEKELIKYINLDKDLVLNVGFLENAKYPNGESVASVAKLNEFGTNKIPARPFMTQSILKNKNKWLTALLSILQNDFDYERSLNKLGVLVKSDIQVSITNFNNPPNSIKTILKKGSSNPLIDTGLMRRSVDYIVKKA